MTKGNEMKLKKIEHILKEEYGEKVSAKIEDRVLTLSGELEEYHEIINLCERFISKEEYSIVNKITLKGVQFPKMIVPKIKDDSLEGKKYDIVIVGAGISGATIARELSKWKLSILVIDKEVDVAMHASSRNDGEIHPGLDMKAGTVKQRYINESNKMYETLSKELNFPFKRVGQLVGIKGPFMGLLAKFYLKNKIRKVNLLESRVVSKQEFKKMEPHISDEYNKAVFTGTAGIVCPYGATIAFCENAIENGVEFSLSTALLSMVVENETIVSVETNRGTLYPKLLINCAGCFADDIAEMAEDVFYSIHPRKGTNSILDKKMKYLVNTIVTPLEMNLSKKHTKGGGTISTVHGNLLLGPNAVETYEKENFETEKEAIAGVFKKQKLLIPQLSERDIITYFTGVRASTFEEDYVIEMGRKCRNILHVAGIQSPGLTTAPAVAQDVELMAIDFFSKDYKIEQNEKYNKHRKGIVSVKDLSFEERDNLIKKNPDYGEIVCRCEEISKGEILDALNSPLKCDTVDGIKRRLRPGMGRCQGGFCGPLIAKIIAQHKNTKISQVNKSGDGSFLSFGKIKGGDNFE